jgi:transcriptional regulator with XRE-family HTH domain
MAKKRYSDVVSMMREITDDAHADDLARHLSGRRIIRKLLALRGARGLSQEEIAERLGCTQSRVSKLEAGTDAALALGDLEGYADALGLNVRIVLMDKETTDVDEVKYHAVTINKLMDDLTRRAPGPADRPPLSIEVYGPADRPEALRPR